MKKHMGPVILPSESGYDSYSAFYGTAFVEGGKIYYYYSGADVTDPKYWRVCLATSTDGINFKKHGPLLDIYSTTPTIVKIEGYYYMFFSHSKKINPFLKGRTLTVAYSDDPMGPWDMIKVLIKPDRYWEGWDIDLGTCFTELTDNEIILYYSNVGNKRPFTFITGPRYWKRFLGILVVKIKSPKNISCFRYPINPLKHLNGPKGSPSESLFCPGIVSLENKNYLLPTMSTYSVGFPYKQYIGIMDIDNDPFLNRSTKNDISVLLDGPKERQELLPNIKSEIALDSPSPVYRDDKIYLYYSVTDRHDDTGKIALSIFDKWGLLHGAT